MQLSDVIPAGIAALILHEVAHVAVALALRVKIYQVGLSWRGPYVRRDCGTTKQNLAVTLAGPGANLGLALLFNAWSPSFALCNLVIGITNILPLPASDGDRAFNLLTAMRGALGSSPPRGAHRLRAPGRKIAAMSSAAEPGGQTIILDSEAA